MSGVMQQHGTAPNAQPTTSSSRSADGGQLSNYMDEEQAMNYLITGGLVPPEMDNLFIPSEPITSAKASSASAQDVNFSVPILNKIPHILPHEKVFSVQVGDMLFRLSGASLSSDAPSYFTSFFQSQAPNAQRDYPVLHIDRSPEVFRDIVRHLQGYYVVPRDEYHFVYLYADAHYYQLPKLVKALFNSEIFVRIGARQFRIPKELLSKPGDAPNFFTLGFSSFFASPQEVFPGTKGLIRPPAVAPPSVPTHSDELFDQLLQALKGTPLKFQSMEYRDLLIKECRYYHFRALEQKLIPVKISRNLLTGRDEICLRLCDVKPGSTSLVPCGPEKSRVQYKRPFTDDPDRELVLEVGSEDIVMRAYDITTGGNGEGMRCKWGVQFVEGTTTAAKMTAILATVADGVPSDSGPVRLPMDLRDACVHVDGIEILISTRDDGTVDCLASTMSTETSNKRQRGEGDVDVAPLSRTMLLTGSIKNLAVSRAQFKMYILRNIVVMHMLTVEAVSSVREDNRRRAFLMG
ncbi:uncharacterized protein V1518DRAFT_413151 [Limtongia smithiae]|uniref:uncharacterized protein n=1 Tax=Limtongia smithiae TaxID=1125753 RepID=UPI0034CF1D3D